MTRTTFRHGAIFLLALSMTFSSAVVLEAEDWPSFRGPNGSGTSDEQDLPVEWSVPSSTNVLWQTAVPGLAHSSPIVSGERIYITTAVGTGARPTLATGDLGAAGYRAAADDGPHRWILFALDRSSGEVIWQTTVHEGRPRVRRHTKASHASATPATNGERIVALMGSEGLFCFDTSGRLLWKRDVGLLDVGMWRSSRSNYQWGPASSPVIYQDLVFVLNDRQRSSFLVAYRLEDGEEVWRTPRDEKPSWTTPVVFRGERAELITHGANYVRAYDPETGSELWRLSNQDSEVIIPMPVISGNVAILSGGYPASSKSVYAIRLGARGHTHTVPDVVWRTDRGSPYTPTPVVYQGIVYACHDNGILYAYELETGERIYRVRIAVGPGFSASPVASDGRLYFASEDGIVYVVRAGREYELLAENDMGEILMATPAISNGTLLIRGRDHLFAVARR
jgi:outer membrane protein assembly factor BamB